MKAILAPWVLPVVQPPIANGAVVFNADREIVYVGEQDHMPKCDVVERHAGHAILPGLVNAHTHLEFSDLKKPIGQPGMEFTKWISEVIACRRGQNQTEEDKTSAIKSGLQQSLDHGVAAIGEIATTPLLAEHYANATNCFLNVFQEALGADPSDYDRKLAELRSNKKLLKENEIVSAISPHAPYSVPPALLQRLINVAVETDSSVAIHLAETTAEREFVELRSGPFVEMLKQFGVWQPKMYAAKDSILKILKTVSQARRILIIHGNYLNENELDFIATVKEKMSVVFCPRTHQYFRHDDYPIEAILNRGINLAVGTDSRASNPDLNLMHELKEIRQRFPNLCSEAILEIGTINGATALDAAHHLGTLEQGRAGRFCFAKLLHANDPYSWLM